MEKPPHEEALRLLASGGLWNTMVVVGSRLGAVAPRAASHVPAMMHHFERYLGALHQPAGVPPAHPPLRADGPADLSRDILQAASGLAVVPVVGSGWFDCGTPERLRDWLSARPPILRACWPASANRARAGSDRTLLEESEPGAPRCWPESRLDGSTGAATAANVPLP